MSYATSYQPAYQGIPASERRFGYSVVASSIVHGLLIVALASVTPTLTLAPNLLGLAGPLQVELNEEIAPVIEPLPEPMSPIAMPTFLPTPEPIALEALLRNAPVLPSTASGTVTTQPLVVRQGPPNINGSVAVGPLGNPERVSVATAARLAQRFPVHAARPPLPRGAVITSYPPEAAHSHISARIAAILTIDAAGKVVPEDTRLVPDDPMFHAPVLEAIAGAEFTPAELDGDPMSYWLILEFVFYIDPAPRASTASGR
jgi:Gram-negative bacterial TonB protein C-terminal